MTEPNPHWPPPLPTNPPAQAPYHPLPYTPAPMAALPISYAMPEPRRPGIISAIGVISIVVASLTAIASLVSGCQAVGLYAISRVSANRPRQPAPPGNTFPAGTPSTPSTSANPSSQPSVLTSAEVATVMQSVQQMAGNRLTASHLNALITALNDPNQQIVLPGTSGYCLNSAAVDSTGKATLHFSEGTVIIDSMGHTSTLLNSAFAVPAVSVNEIACALTGVDAVLSLGMAVLLFVGGILILRPNPGGRGIHLAYALIKIPLVLGGTAAATWMFSDFYGSVAATTPGGAGAMQNVAMMWGAGFAVVGLIYPIALLIALNTRGVRAHFGIAGK